jgi:hypothetical protein
MVEILFLILLLITLGSYIYIESRFHKYKKISLRSKMTGFEVAREIIDNHSMNNTYITEIRSGLISYYDPIRKVIRLKKGVFNNTSLVSCGISAMVAANTIEEKNNNKLVKLRDKVTPVLNILLYLSYIIIAIGAIFGHVKTTLIGIGLDYVILLFHLFTLSIEKKAKKIAYKELIDSKIICTKEKGKVLELLNCLTYKNVACIILPVVQLVKEIISFGNSNEEEK